MQVKFNQFLWFNSPSGPRLPHCWGFEITLRNITLGRRLWTSYRPVAETCTSQHITLFKRGIRGPGGIRTSNSSQREVTDPHLIGLSMK